MILMTHSELWLLWLRNITICLDDNAQNLNLTFLFYQFIIPITLTFMNLTQTPTNGYAISQRILLNKQNESDSRCVYNQTKHVIQAHIHVGLACL